MFSAVQHPEIIDEYISKELRLGRILATSCHPAIHINRFGVIPKAVARWPGGQGGQLPPQLALKKGRQTDDRGAPAAKQITRNVFN